ncbi:hypothetical protein [Streptomyces sp. NPDC048473]|uniref:hypothetical protein n=1 Tax=unclassified Streptomyces TaxID=2593676 RepID=UPI003719E6BC
MPAAIHLLTFGTAGPILVEMGVDIEVLIVDWERVEAAPASRRGDLLHEAAFGDESSGGLDEAGWIWPSAADAGWYGRYAFRNTLGSYKPHFWAGERWEDVRDFADPGLRTALDHFASLLFWQGLAYVAGEDVKDIPAQECPWGVEQLLWCSPGDVSTISRSWAQAQPELDTLREPFAEHAAVPRGWICDFESFAEFLVGWGEVVVEADRRGWGIVGLRC